MTKTYTKFIDVLEIVYAILMSWGIARVAEKFEFNNIYNWAGLILVGLIIIRLFFAPSHNIGALVRSVKMSLPEARKIMFIDIPVLIGHSFLYYRLCYNLSNKEYMIFYQECAVLLLLNSAWIFYINIRLKASGVSVPAKFHIWTLNNVVCSVSLFVVLALYAPFNAMGLTTYFWISFMLVFLNCFIDLRSCSLNYLEDSF